MTDVARALYQFFSGFDIPAYTEYNVPDEATLPYITYQLVQPEWIDSGTLYARVWYRSTSLAGISAKVNQISEAVGRGVTIPFENGCVMLNKGTPWAQEMPMEGDTTLKVVYLNFVINAFA